MVSEFESVRCSDPYFHMPKRSEAQCSLYRAWQHTPYAFQVSANSFYTKAAISQHPPAYSVTSSPPESIQNDCIFSLAREGGFGLLLFGLGGLPWHGTPHTAIKFPSMAVWCAALSRGGLLQLSAISSVPPQGGRSHDILQYVSAT